MTDTTARASGLERPGPAGVAPLRAYLDTGRMPLSVFLRIGPAAARALQSWHDHGRIHGDLKPDRILLDPSLSRVELSEGVESGGGPHPSGDSVRTLAYMSPEQTGRTNRAVDYRSDIYSLGVTLYEMLTGKLPHQADTPMEWMHAHLAVQPAAPRQVDPLIPQPVSDIVEKCLQKNPDHRYQSAFGLWHDLHVCREQWEKNGDIPHVELGRRDIPCQIMIPDKLYARENELLTLREAYDHAHSGGQATVIITAESGGGKSALIRRFRRNIRSSSGIFASGKCDQTLAGTPLAPFRDIVRELLRSLLSKDEKDLQVWRNRLASGLGSNVPLIASLLPEFELVMGRAVGDRAPLGEWSTSAVQGRMYHAAKSLFQVFATETQPLVVFLDDLQWADTDTVHLLSGLSRDVGLPHILWIVAVRPGFEDRLHPLVEGDLENPSMRWIRLLPLEPFHAFDIAEILSDSLRLPADEANRLARVVHRKTRGNPLFTLQLVRSLAEEGSLWFNGSSGRWEYNLESIEDRAVTDNVLDWLLGEILHLPEPTRQLLSCASCGGTHIDAFFYARVLGIAEEEAELRMQSALNRGLVSVEGDPERGRYRFLHDQIQQAFYSLIPDENRSEMHAAIGQALYEDADAEHRDNRLFETVHHLNLGRKHIADRTRLARLNLRAAKGSATAAAFDSAFTYAETGVGLLEPGDWDTDFPLAFELHLELAKAEYAVNRFDDAKDLLDSLLRRARNVHERVLVYKQLSFIHSQFANHKRATKLAIDALRELGVRLNFGVRRRQIILPVLLSLWRLRRLPSETVLAMPEIRDTSTRDAMSLLRGAGGSAYHISHDLEVMIFVKMFELTRRRGLTPDSAVAFGDFGMLLCAGMGRFDQGFRMGELSMRLADRFNQPDVLADTYFIYATYIHHWHGHMRRSLAYLIQAERYCLECGNLWLAGAATAFVVILKILLGDPLPDVMQTIRHYEPFVDQGKHHLSKEFIVLSQEVLGALQLPSPGPVPDVSVENEFGMFSLGTIRLMVLYLLGDHAGAVSLSRRIAPKPGTVFYSLETPDYALFTALSICATASPQDGRKACREAGRHVRRLARWARNSPDNYRHKFLLASAEYARVLGKDREAEVLYEQAAAAAEEQGFTHMAAVASELAGRFHQTRGRNKLATTYLMDAVKGYRHWGARAKVHELVQSYPQLAAVPGANSFHFQTIAASSEDFINEIDVRTLIEVSQSISGEIVLERLLVRLLQTMLQYAGAEKGCIALSVDGDLHVEVEGRADEDNFRVLTATPLDYSRETPPTVLRYVARTKEPLMLDDARADERFFKDPYIVRTQPRSALCLPIVNSGHLVGVLYLENSSTAGIFNASHVNLLGTLATQAAISIENAYLYETLERRIQARTLALNESNESLRAANEELARSEELRRRLLSNVSHDLRSPLSAIQGYAEAILEGVIPGDETPRYVERIHTRVLGLNRLIEDLFALSTSEENRPPSSNLAWTPLPAVTRALRERYEIDIVRADLHFEFYWRGPGAFSVSAPEEAEAVWIQLDRDRFDRVCSNLVQNAIQHTPPGGYVRISAELRRDAGTSGRVLLHFQDTGCGIGENDLPYIFERYYQAKQTSRRTKKGSGLGLAIAREIVEQHNGSIRVTSVLNSGTTFTLDLPVRFEPPPDVP